MKNTRTTPKFLLLALLLAAPVTRGLSQSTREGQTKPKASPEYQVVKRGAEPVAAMALNRNEARWRPNMEYDQLVLTVSTPGGEVIRREFAAGEAPSFKITDDNGAPLPDGSYVYELRLIPAVSADAKDALQRSREREEEDGAEAARERREMKKKGQIPAQELIQNGSFLVKDGGIFLSGVEKGGETGSLSPAPDYKNNPVAPAAGRGMSEGMYIPATVRPAYSFANATDTFYRPVDQVVADDQIVQGSLCVGFDCVNNENFGFDTIRLKENNTRIKFEDTSASAGFPSNDWQLTANDSASGGLNKFSIEDITGARVPFTVTAGAPTNSMFMDSSGRLGLRTATPVLDVHVNTSNSPAHRLEQNASGGFTAQTWDIAGNEANFFVRDVTGGSRLPFRIRPGAPTSSIDIAASGRVGLGTASPAVEMHVVKNGNFITEGRVENTTDGLLALAAMRVKSNLTDMVAVAHATSRTEARYGVAVGGFGELIQVAGNGLLLGTLNNTPMILGTNSVNRVNILGNGNIGLGGQANPTSPIHHANGATLSAGGAWLNGSSRALKTNIHNLSGRDAMAALRAMNPVTFQYRTEPRETYVGFIAEEVPALVATGDRKGLSSMDVVAVLTKVVQEQQDTINQLKLKVEQLEKGQTPRRRARR
ncbi:MAG: tail fiber domain-containing protein [Blastocatellia bacterium]